jgi:flagellar biogenesis protein FliO
VVGVTGSQINTLSTMPKQEISATENDAQIRENPFADWLKKTIEKRKANQV